MGGIVVGVDGSPGAVRALEWAVGEARLRATGLTLVHAWHIPTSVKMATPGLPLADWAVLEDAARQILAQAAEQVRRAGVEVEPVLVERYAAPALIEQGRGADLLVVGSRGRGGFTGLLLGSVSQEVAHHARCPLVIVPPPPD